MKTKIILIILCLLALVGCGSSTANQGVASTPTVTTTKATPTPAPAHHFKVGQVVTVGDAWDITINSARVSPHGQYSQPQHMGDVFLIFQISVKNTSSQEQNMSSLLQFQLTDTTGQKYTVSYDDEAGATLDGKVAAGDMLKGSLVYEVPSSGHDFRLAFTAQVFEAGQVTWDVHV